MIRILALALLGACAVQGMGPGVRNDIAAQMQAAGPALSTCYATGLAAGIRGQGTIVLSFAAAPDTGQFVDVAVVQDQVNDPNLRQCVVAAVSAQKLAQPQNSRVAISYPIHFAPKP